MMNSNEVLIAKFYNAFAQGDVKTMIECYHTEVHFTDPVFGLLKKEQVFQMWTMLLSRSKGGIDIKFSDVKADEHSGSANWIATYHFSKSNRRVINKVAAQFIFKDGRIISHTDHFDLWKWSKQAFGLTGYLIGWTGFFQKKINQEAIVSLEKFTKVK